MHPSATRFTVGQSVQISPLSLIGTLARGAHMITDIMPPDRVGRCYQIKSSFDGQLRHAHENELMEMRGA